MMSDVFSTKLHKLVRPKSTTLSMDIWCGISPFSTIVNTRSFIRKWRIYQNEWAK